MKKKIIKKKISDSKIKVKRPVKPQKQARKKEIITFGLHNLIVPRGAHKPKKLLGRGTSSGHGKTSARGSKGQTSRAGRHFYLGFEGGQSPLIRRFPKRGFVNEFAKSWQIINLKDLNRIKDGIVNPQVLLEKGLIKDIHRPVKVLGDGELKNPLTLQAHAFSKKAEEKIKNSGGKTEIVALNK